MLARNTVACLAGAIHSLEAFRVAVALDGVERSGLAASDGVLAISDHAHCRMQLLRSLDRLGYVRVFQSEHFVFVLSCK